MSIATSLYTLGNAIDPSMSHWTVLLSTGKTRSERELIPTLRAGMRGVRPLDWTIDLVSTGDIYRVKEISLNCPDGRKATLEIIEPGTVFQLKTRSLNFLGASSNPLEYQVIGRVLDKASGQCECFIWDYHPNGPEHLLAYRSNIYQFGSWRDNIMPLGVLAHDVQGFRL